MTRPAHALRHTTVAAVAIAIVALTAGESALAVIYLGGEEVVIAADEIIDDDVIATAGSIRVDGIVEGDLLALGKEITINGRVESDLLAIAETAIIRGAVGDDARIGALAVLLAQGAEIGDDLFTATFSLETSDQSRIGGTLLFAGYQALLVGHLQEHLAAWSNAIELAGFIGGEVRARLHGGQRSHSSVILLTQPSIDLPELAPGLRITGEAEIGGDLDYSAAFEADMDPRARIHGAVSFARAWGAAPRPPPTGDVEGDGAVPGAGSSLASHAQRFGRVLILGTLLLLAAPGWTARLASTLWHQPMGSLGWGLGAVVVAVGASIAVGLVSVILLFGLRGSAASIIGFGLLLEIAIFAPFVLAAAVLPPILASLGAGRWLVGKLRPGSTGRLALPFVTGVVAYVALRAIPVVGVLAWMAICLLGLGALAQWLRDVMATPLQEDPPPAQEAEAALPRAA